MNARQFGLPIAPGAGRLPVSAPSYFGRRLRVAAFALALAAITIVSTAGTTLAWDASALSPGDEQLLLMLTNQDRGRAGLGALVNDTYLHKEAEWRAKDMGDKGYFSHNIPPSNSQVFTYMQADGYCFTTAGENIGYSTYSDDVVTANIEVAFMASPGHRANILGAWTHIGVGAYKASDGRKLFAVLFSIPCGVTAPAPAAPAKAAVPTRKPTAKPVARPAATVGPTATPSAVPTPSVQPTVTPSPIPPTPTPSPTPLPAGAPSLGPAGAQDAPAAASNTSGEPTSLRVRDDTTSRGLIDSLFGTFFGGLFGS